MAKTKICDDCTYNCTKQLAQKLDLLWRLDDYIKEAKKMKHSECVKIFERIKKDTKKHAELLRDVLTKKAKKK